MKVSKELAVKIHRELTLALALIEQHIEIPENAKAVKILGKLSQLVEDQTVKTV